MDKNSDLLQFLNASDETLKKWCGSAVAKSQSKKPIFKKGKIELFAYYGGRAVFEGYTFSRVKREQNLLRKFYRKMLHNEEFSYEDIKLLNSKLKDVRPVLHLMEDFIPEIFKEGFSKRRTKEQLRKIGFDQYDVEILSEEPKLLLHYLDDFKDLLTTNEIEEYIVPKKEMLKDFKNDDKKKKHYLRLHRLIESMEEPRKIKYFRLGWATSGFSGYWFELVRKISSKQTLPPACEKCGFIIPTSKKSSVESRQKKSKDKILLCPRCRQAHRVAKYRERQKEKSNK